MRVIDRDVLLVEVTATAPGAPSEDEPDEPEPNFPNTWGEAVGFDEGPDFWSPPQERDIDYEVQDHKTELLYEDDEEEDV